MRKSTTTLAAALVLSVLIGASAPASFSAVVPLDKATQGHGNKGASFRPVDGLGGPANFVLTGRTGIDETEPFDPSQLGQAGTVCIEQEKGKNPKKGAGVQKANGKGSTGISGTGGDKDEELIFTYDFPVFVNSVAIGLVDIDFGAGLDDEDDPVIFLSTVGSGVIVVKEPGILSGFTDTGGGTGTIDFAGFSLPASLTITGFGLRETNGHLFVTGLTAGTEVPEVATMLLLGIGGAAILIKRRKLIAG